MQIQYPLKDIEFDISNTIFNEFMKLPSPKNVKSASFMYEEILNNFSYSYAIGHYENISVNIPPEIIAKKNRNNSLIKLNKEYISISERGLNINLTIREKDILSKETNIKESYDRILNTTLKEMNSSFEKLIYRK